MNAARKRAPHLVWVITYFLLIVVSQTGAIIFEVIDWDEVTFILSAESVHQGNLPYTQLFDNKPPLMFFALAGVLSLFGDSLGAVRLFGDACLFVSATGTYLVTLRLTRDSLAAGMAGTVCVALHCFRFAQWTSTELLATALLVIALWILITPENQRRNLFLAGSAISLAVLTRSNLVFVAVAFCLYFLVEDVRRTTWHRLSESALLPFAAGGLIPVGLLISMYAVAGQFGVLKLSTVDIPLRYATEQLTAYSAIGIHFARWCRMVIDQPAVLGIISILALVGLARSVNVARSHRRRAIAFCWLMILSIGLSIAQTGTAWIQYWIQLFPFLAVLTGFAVSLPIRPLRMIAIALGVVSVVAAIRMTLPSLIVLLQTPDAIARFHSLHAVAQYIDGQRKPSDEVWATGHGGNHLLLWYLKRPPVTRPIVHPSNLARKPIVDGLIDAGLIPTDFLSQLYDSRPAFVVAGEPGSAPLYEDQPRRFTSYLKAHYEISYRARGTTVYRRVD